VREKCPRPWHAIRDKDQPTVVDFSAAADLERINIHDATGEYLFTVAGQQKAKDILLIVNGGEYAFEIDYSFSGFSGSR
jgi:hypothetical protein